MSACRQAFEITLMELNMRSDAEEELLWIVTISNFPDMLGQMIPFTLEARPPRL